MDRYLDSVVEFVNEMAPLEAMNKNQKKDKARKKEDLPTGNALEPSYVYKTLLQLESETFKVSSQTLLGSEADCSIMVRSLRAARRTQRSSSPACST